MFNSNAVLPSIGAEQIRVHYNFSAYIWKKKSEEDPNKSGHFTLKDYILKQCEILLGAGNKSTLRSTNVTELYQVCKSIF